jgi:biopolymer transport protein ExbB
MLTLNTTTTGADIHSDLAGFPTLVRADSSWFDFAEARPDGSDILVFSAEGKRLPVEINEWNAIKKEGQIWIRLDSLKANARTKLHLVWGNTKVTQLLSLPVFDTTDGHVAVLHLESANTMAEATGSLKVGLDSGSTKVKGIIGEAIQFKTGTNNILTYLDEGKLGVGKTLENLKGCTFSWWMRPDENLDTVSTRRTLFAKGQGWDGEVDEDWAIWIKDGALILEGRAPSGVDSSDWTQATLPAGPWEMGRWYYMAIVYDGKSVQLFKNGEPMGMAISFDHSFIPSNDTPAFSIGKHSLSRPELLGFSGALDEIRIQQKTLSIEWIRACYRNQAMHNALVSP